MLIKRDAGVTRFISFEKNCVRLFLLLCIGFFINFLCPQSLHGNVGIDVEQDGLLGNKEIRVNYDKNNKLMYYLYVADFAQSFIEIPTSNVLEASSTISSKYLAGRAAVYNKNNEKVGTCSASFLCMQNADGIYTDISNYLSVDSGLIVSWFTPTTLINLELDSIINSMITKCIVVASTEIGFNPFFGKTFDLVVSSDDGKIYFNFSKR